ncbi:hypothetical protein QNX24_001844 [Vibrio alginolyticus]|nr:hypothetical protein [Vibrio alginolyticus]ELB2280497.1 hypothetical protein [Vibrio alginolyticus]
MMIFPFDDKSNISYELRKLKISTRNKVRAIVSASDKESIDLMNNLREKCNVTELYQAEKAVKALSIGSKLLPDLFPKDPQFKEDFIRLNNLSFEKKLSYMDNIIKSNRKEVERFFEDLFKINESIYQNNLFLAEKLIKKAIDEHGHSHILLRKAIFVISNDEMSKFNSLSKIIKSYGVRSNVVNTLLYCFKEEQDYLSVKKSVMSTKDRGVFNQFTRDLLRIGFHPHAKNTADLIQLIQSCLQSSLVDAIIIMKVNGNLFDKSKYHNIDWVFKLIDNNSKPIQKIANLTEQYEDSEGVFFQRSCAWLENNEVVEYRLLIDHFSDSPESPYFEMNDELISRITKNVKIKDIEEILTSENLLEFGGSKLSVNKSSMSNSALLNLMIHINEGMIITTEDVLLRLMENTRDLARTINIRFIKNFILSSPSKLSEIVLLLLIYKRSKNESDHYKLRRKLQNYIIEYNESNLVSFVDSVAKKSQAVAEFTYEVCTEDFISKLSHIIGTTEKITETRASLHDWMGDLTGDNNYKVRAKNLRIDHKINLVKGELDDNRIYVDTSKFLEWMQDEIAQDLTTVLSFSMHDKEVLNTNEPQIIQIISKCYSEFCSNNLFGIASYLGRRLRHGTFKGHLYHGVVNEIEQNYDDIISDPLIYPLWMTFKESYKNEVDSIVKNKLHIKNSSTFEGFLSPEITGHNKIEVLTGCINNIYSDFDKNNSSYNAILLINEYCWRLAEIDMRAVHGFLKSRKSYLVDLDLLNEIKRKTLQIKMDESRVSGFCREVQRLVNDKLTDMYGWFKKPQSVSPKASLNLLYKVVVTEVKQSFPNFQPDTSFEEDNDIELIGGAYHVLYDALYVIVFNAAKHGKNAGSVYRNFSIDRDELSAFVRVKFDSEICDSSNESSINKLLKVELDDADIDTAQTVENLSGIKKLYHLDKYDGNFEIITIECVKRKVCIEMIYRLGHL